MILLLMIAIKIFKIVFVNWFHHIIYRHNFVSQAHTAFPYLSSRNYICISNINNLYNIILSEAKKRFSASFTHQDRKLRQTFYTILITRLNHSSLDEEQIPCNVVLYTFYFFCNNFEFV